MFIEALFAIAKTRKYPKCPQTDEQIKKMGYIYIYTHTLEYYLATKKNKVMPFATTWIQLESITLSEGSRRRMTNTIGYH